LRAKDKKPPKRALGRILSGPNEHNTAFPQHSLSPTLDFVFSRGGVLSRSAKAPRNLPINPIQPADPSDDKYHLAEASIASPTLPIVGVLRQPSELDVLLYRSSDIVRTSPLRLHDSSTTLPSVPFIFFQSSPCTSKTLPYSALNTLYSPSDDYSSPL